MGIDLKAGGVVNKKHGNRKNPKSRNPYLQLLTKLYKFLERRTDSKFNAVIRRRLCQTKKSKAPLSLSRLSTFMKKHENKTACIVGPVVDDNRLLECPKLSVCALRFTETARARIVKAGGECLTFDQLALRAPKGTGCVLLRGPIKARRAESYFGRAPGLPNSTTRPKVRRATNLKRKSRKFEQARGKRNSRGYKA